MAEQLYCSVDLELTGFDPLRDQILEIGFAFFRVSEKGTEVTEEWSQVFKPSVEVHPKILGLTGITHEELDAAPNLSDFHDFLQDKLGDATLVCHNVAMDVKFLEAFGLKLSGRYVDTLDLVQFILPTHHSYNLENLMHYFGVAHPEAHRALADCRATISVLEKLLQAFQSFPEELRDRLMSVMHRLDVPWHDLFKVSLAPLPAPSAAKPESLPEKLLQLPPNSLVVHSGSGDSPAVLAASLQNQENPSLLVVPSAATVMDLWRRGLAHGVFRSQDLFDHAKFEHLLSSVLTLDQGKFCLKVLVWLHTNWQTEAILDLNLSFFGGQFRSLITGASPAAPNAHVVVCDHQTFFEVAAHPSYHNRHPVVASIHEFEQDLTRGQGGRISWNGILYVLKNIYNPETKFGNKSLEQEVVAALTGADLFFGLVSMSVAKHFKQNRYVTIEQLADNDHVFNQLVKASKNFLLKLETVVSQAPSVELSKYMQALDFFFAEDSAYVAWLEVSETNVGLHKQPLDIVPVSNALFSSFAHTPTFIDNLPLRPLLEYYLTRLGMKPEFVEAESSEERPIQIRLEGQSASDERILAELQPSALPAVAVLAELPEIKEFYNAHYRDLQEYAAIMAQGYSGGGTKMFRNFGIKPNSLLLITAGFLVRHHRPLTPKTLMIAQPPVIDSTHPYTAALLTYWQELFPNLHNLLNVQQLLEVITLCYSPALQTVAIFSQSGLESEQEQLKNLLKQLPWVSIE
jgi:DNA polymerase III epsilon subunit-like protein